MTNINKLFIALFIVSLIGLVLFFSVKTEWQGIIIGFEWKREQDIERYQIVGGSCWFWSCTPDRAYNITSRTEIHHWVSVPSGEICRTNTQNIRTCTTNYTNQPVYERKFYYDVNLWRVGRLVQSTGNTNKQNDLYWPELTNLNDCGVFELGIGANDKNLNCERAGQKREFYSISIKPDVEYIRITNCLVNYAKWSDTPVNTKINGYYWFFQNLIDCNNINF